MFTKGFVAVCDVISLALAQIAVCRRQRICAVHIRRATKATERLCQPFGQRRITFAAEYDLQ